MIRPLRRRHRRMIVVVAVVTAVLAVAALLSRRDVPANERIPEAAAVDASGSATEPSP